MSRDLLVRVTSFAALESNGRFSCRVATTKVQQPQNIPRCVRTQQDLNTSPMGSYQPFAAFCANDRCLVFDQSTILLA
jgi:hypothetical protein